MHGALSTVLLMLLGGLIAYARLPQVREIGQPVEYVRAQFVAFAAGERHDDIDGEMRSFARESTPQSNAEVTSAHSRPRR